MGVIQYDSGEKVLVRTGAKRPTVLERVALRVHYEWILSLLGRFVLAIPSGSKALLRCAFTARR